MFEELLLFELIKLLLLVLLLLIIRDTSQVNVFLYQFYIKMMILTFILLANQCFQHSNVFVNILIAVKHWVLKLNISLHMDNFYFYKVKNSFYLNEKYNFSDNSNKYLFYFNVK